MARTDRYLLCLGIFFVIIVQFLQHILVKIVLNMICNYVTLLLLFCMCTLCGIGF